MTRRGEEDSPEGGECAHVKVEDRDAEEGGEDVGGPYLSERKPLSWRTNLVHSSFWGVGLGKKLAVRVFVFEICVRLLLTQNTFYARVHVDEPVGKTAATSS